MSNDTFAFSIISGLFLLFMIALVYRNTETYEVMKKHKEEKRLRKLRAEIRDAIDLDHIMIRLGILDADVSSIKYKMGEK